MLPASEHSNKSITTETVIHQMLINFIQKPSNVSIHTKKVNKETNCDHVLNLFLKGTGKNVIKPVTYTFTVQKTAGFSLGHKL